MYLISATRIKVGKFSVLIIFLLSFSSRVCELLYSHV